MLGFGDGPPAPLQQAGPDGAASAQAPRSDLGAAFRALAASAEERPAAVVVVSDGRLDDPPEGASEETLRALGALLHVPIATIAAARESPPDASIRRVSAAGAAVAHVPLPVRVEVGCAGGLACEEVTVTARELRDDGPPAVLASGVAHVKDGKAALDLTMVLDRAGARIVEIAVSPQRGDTIPENDRRFVTFNVTRDRVRLLHVAGRPTNDVRALRQWIKSDASVDVVAFFILRTQRNDVRATQNNLALIPFPVDELFQEHLPSFDAIVLQDFDAQPYGLEKYLENIRRYVRRGGGLVMVGGENSFVAGGYAGTPLADVLPIALDGSASASSADRTPFVPEWTPEGLSSPVLSPLRTIVEDELPQMPGANVLGDLKPGGVALWSHPTRSTKSGAKMPVLAVGDEGDGRSIALGVDGTWELEFSELGARTAGRGHGALWDGLLGWLMRDPRFEPARNGGRWRMHDRPTVGIARPDARGGQERSADDRGRDRAYRPAASRDPRRAPVPSRGAVDRSSAPSARNGRLHGPAARRGRLDDALRLRMRGWRRRVGRLAAGPESARSDRQGDRRRVCVRVRRGLPKAPESDYRERRAARDSAGPAVGLDDGGGRPSRNSLDHASTRRPAVKKTAVFVLSGFLAMSPARAGAIVWPDVAERVERDLSAADPSTRRAAARELASLGPVRGAPLVTAALGDPDDDVRLAAADAAIRLRAAGATDAVAAWLNAPDVRLRRKACDVARALPSARAVAPLARTLSDPDAEVRAAAAEALGHQSSGEAVAPLLGRLDDPTPAVRLQIVGALARLGDARAVVPLTGKVQDSSPDVRQAVARALGDLGDPRGSPALILALRDQTTK